MLTDHTLPRWWAVVLGLDRQQANFVDYAHASGTQQVKELRRGNKEQWQSLRDAKVKEHGM